jgi:hypothetical protein
MNTISLVKIDVGDFVVLSTETFLTKEQGIEAQKSIKVLFPKNEVIILSGGVKLDVLTKEQLKKLLGE